MDRRLEDSLARWREQIEKVKEIESLYFELDSSEKSFFASLYMKVQGGSVAARQNEVYASADYQNFSRGLAKAKGDYLHEKRILETYIKSYEGEYMTFKLENETIKKGGW